MGVYAWGEVASNVRPFAGTRRCVVDLRCPRYTHTTDDDRTDELCTAHR